MDINGVLKATILKKLKRRGKAKEVATELIKEGLLLSKPTSYGLEVSLNPERKEEIAKIIQKYLSG